MGVRLVSWNCNGGFHHKDDDLFRLDPDIAVVSEASEKSVADLKDCSSVWIGGRAKGLAVIARNGWTVADTGIRLGETYFLPVTLSRGAHSMKLLATWVVARGSAGYVQPTLAAMEQLRDFISGDDVIVTGDLNQNVLFDKKRSERRRFQTVLDEFGRHGVTSLWHTLNSQAHGREEVPTYFHHFVRERPFHIDYAFAAGPMMRRVTDMAIGRYEDWVRNRLSDHVPLVIDFK